MISKTKDFILNNYNVHKFDEDNYLLTTEQGSWSLLSKGEYDRFRLGKVGKNSELYKHLQERGLILTQGNVSQVVKKHALKNQFLFTQPSLHIIIPTLRCNQRCSYCHSMPADESQGKFDLDPETGKKIVDFALQTNSKTVRFEFQGGEPLLNFPVVEEVVDYADQKAEEGGKKIGFSLVTNLTVLDDDILDKLREREIQITTSLDGPKEVHDFNRKYLNGEGTYGEVVEKIRQLKEEGVDVQALSTITEKSLGFGKEIVDEYRKLGLDYIWLRPLNRIGFASESWGKVGYTPEEFMNFYSDTLDYILERKKIKELYAVLLAKKILGIKDPEMTEMTSPCGAGLSQLLYDCNGDIYTCDEGKIYEEFKLGNVEKSDWSDLFESDLFVSMLDLSSKKNYLCDNCEWEPFCAICPVNTYSEQDTVVSKLPEDFRCGLHGNLIHEIFERLLFSKQRKTLQRWAREEKIFG